LTSIYDLSFSSYTEPDVIRNLRVSEITTSSVFLTWEEPAGNRDFFKFNWTDEKTSNHVTTNSPWYNITDLTAGVNYTFIITAVAADKSTEGESVVTSKYTKPDVIMNITAADITTSSVLLNWTKPNGQSSHYRVEYENNSVTTENTSIEINDLTPGAQYTFRVFAVAADHVTEGRANQISLYTKPDVIRNLRVSEITTSSVFLTWEEPAGNRSFFILNWTDEKLDLTRNSIETTNTSYNITGLTAGVNYTFIITAVTADKSTEGESLVTSNYTKPDVIMNLTAADITTSSVLLNWTKPNGQSSHYRVEYENNSVTAENTSIEINDLTPGAQYTFRVFAVAADHVTEGSANPISLYTKPDVIRNLRVSEITTSSVFLTWEEPAGNRDFFKLNWTDEKTSNHVTTNNPWYNITDLTAGVNYTFIITAVAADKSTEGESVVTSKYTKPDVIMNITAADITTSSVLLNWTKPNGQSSHYRVEYENNSVTTENTSIEINDLIPGAQYTFRVFAVAADHVTEGRANQISLYTKPDVIRNLRVTNITTSSVFLTWEEPAGNRSFFKLQWTDNKTSENSTETINTSYHITGLTSGVNYTFCITAVTADKSTGGETVCRSQFTKPNVIRKFRVTNITTSSVVLTWEEPIGNRSFFKLHWTDEKTNRNSTETSNTCYNITGLTAGVNYTFIITAVAADKSTEGESAVTSNYTKPDIIMNITAADITTSSVLLNWIKPNGQSSRYRVEYENNSVTTENTSIKINNLTSGAQYTFRVFAVAADHVTEGRANQISLYTKPDVIRNFRVTNITTSSVFLTWDEPFENRSFFKINWADEKTNRNSTETSNTLYYITGLTAGVNYTVCITAVTADKSKGETFCISKYTKASSTSLVVKALGVALTAINLTYSSELCTCLSIFDASPNSLDSKSAKFFLPDDASRVKLSMCGSSFDDYINANYIPGYNSRKEFIAAQGPLPVTVNEFWRMVWEKNVYTIVMLTKCNEMGRVKCEKYWPSGTNHYHNISVTTTSEIELESWTIRDFRIKNVKTAESRYVRQFHFTAWPDHGVPQTTEVLIDFRHLVREHMEQYSRHSPTVVHCSAGVGRTGTFIAIDHLIFQVERDSMVDIFGIVNDMRMHRPLMVQTEEQYVYLHQCAYDIIRSRTGTNVDLIYQNAAALSIYQNVNYQNHVGVEGNEKGAMIDTVCNLQWKLPDYSSFPHQVYMASDAPGCCSSSPSLDIQCLELGRHPALLSLL
ncbi:receptor-type tyrosine-protein phosphatase eta-like, partial [Sinocyclocheilus grahami]|uniref:receptor-type tyrosine-protein phosphatase eta-like n=1 Tax=Sinocyclocheilus grahami TaxID=75366 RepID=UPI0007AC959D